MPSSFSYYYTVEVWENFDVASKLRKATDEFMNSLDTSIQNKLVFSNKTWVRQNAELSSAAKDKLVIEKNSELLYIVRVYMKNVHTSPNYTHEYWLPDLSMDMVNVSINSTWNGYNKFSRGKIQTKADGTEFVNYTLGSAVTQTSPHNLGVGFIFTLKAKETGNFDPVKFNIAISNNSRCCPTQDAPSGPDVDPTTSAVATLHGKNPSITVSASPKIPPIPTELKNAIFNGFNSPNIAFDVCKNRWLGLLLNPKAKNGVSGFEYQMWTDAPAGGKLVSEAPVKWVAPGKGPNRYPTEILSQLKRLVDVTLGDCTNATTTPPTTETAPPRDATPAVPATPPIADLRWNPPPHIASRGVPFGDLIQNNDFAVGKLNKELLSLNTNYFERGRLFQDSAAAKALNNNKKLKLASDAGPKIWGFRFMYNPQSFSYSTSSNNSIDWTLGSADVATLLEGNQNVSFQLYLNRIVDMTALTRSYTNGYPRTLEQEEVDGILNRGTEYDIEFLYRVLNGDPTEGNLLLNPSYKGKTADFGYTTGIPCWLYLNENYRLYGSVAGFQVNHVMFTRDMIPMLSTVDITFTRYPAYSPLKDAGGKTAIGGVKADDIKSLIGSTTQTADGASGQ